MSNLAFRCSLSRLKVYDTIHVGTAKKLATQIKLMEELAKKLAERDYMEADLLESPFGRRANKHTLPCCESGEQTSRINSGRALDKISWVNY